MNASMDSYFHGNGTTSDLLFFPEEGLENNNASGNATIVGRRRIIPTTAAIMFSLGVFGNLLALYVLYKAPKEHKKTVFYRLVGGLAINDLFGTTALSPVTFIIYANYPDWPGGQSLCDYMSFMLIFAGFSTVFVVFAMAFDRFLAIRAPYFYSAKASYSKVKYIFLGSWVASLIIACLPLVGIGKNVKHFPNTWCFFDFYSNEIIVKLFAYIYSCVGLSVILMIAVLNTIVIWTLIKMRKVASVACGGSGNTKRVDSEIQMMVFVVGVLVVFGICWAPLMVHVLLIQIGNFEERKAIDILVVRLASFNQILDPWVYILFRRELFYRCFVCFKRKVTSVPRTVRRLSSVHSKAAKEVAYKSEVTEMTDCFSACMETADDEYHSKANVEESNCKRKKEIENLLTKYNQTDADY